MVHEIKLSHVFFDDVQSGKKSFELRKDDRDYQIGDELLLSEIKDNVLTGRTVRVKVIYKLAGFAGLEAGYCILGIEKQEVTYVET